MVQGEWILITDPINQIPKDRRFLGYARSEYDEIDILEWDEEIGYFRIHKDQEVLTVTQVGKEYAYFCTLDDQPERLSEKTSKEEATV